MSSPQKRNPAPISSHTQCHFPGPRGPPVFLWVCQHVAGLLGLAERWVPVVTLPRNPGFSLLAGMQRFLLKQISFNLLIAFCFSEGSSAQVTGYPRKAGGARGIWKLRGSSAPGPGSPFAAGSLIWGTFPLSPLSKAIEPLPPSSLTGLKTPFSGRVDGARANSQSLYSTNSEGQLWSQLLPSHFVRKQR